MLWLLQDSSFGAIPYLIPTDHLIEQLNTSHVYLSFDYSKDLRFEYRTGSLV